MVAVPIHQHLRESRAHRAITVVHDGEGAAEARRDALMTGDREADDGDGHAMLPAGFATGALSARADGSMETCGGGCSVACTGHSSATRRAAAMRFAGGDGR